MKYPKRKVMEKRIFNKILGDWSEQVSPNIPKIRRELSRMNMKRLKEEYKFQFED